MSDKPKTRADIYLEKLKNNPIIATIIVVAIVLTAIAGFTDSLSKITNFISSFIRDETSLSIKYLVENTTNDNVEVERFSNFYLISPSAPFSVYNTPNGRLLLKPVENTNTNSDYEIAPNQTKRYVAEFPQLANYEDLLTLGGMDIHFAIQSIQPKNSGKIYVIKVPFHKDEIKNLILKFTIANVTPTAVFTSPTATIVAAYTVAPVKEPTGTPTLTLTLTSLPPSRSSTPTNTAPEPTATHTPAPDPPCPYSGDFYDSWISHWEQLGCLKNPINGNQTWLPFDRGNVFWSFKLNGYIVGVDDTGEWRFITQSESDKGNLSCPSDEPPTNRFAPNPNTGIGGLWCRHEYVYPSIGFATAENETSQNVKGEEFDNGYIWRDRFGQISIFIADEKDIDTGQPVKGQYIRD